MSLTACITGIALWQRGMPDWEHALAYVRTGQLADGAPARPAPQLLAPNERRRAPETVAVALEVALAACTASGRDPARLPSVFLSSHGELSITDYMCQTLAQDPGSLSPTRFHNSVHNAAAGYWTIGAGVHAPATAISAGPWSLAQGLLEAAAQLEDGADDVLLVGYDGTATGPLASQTPSSGLLGVALVLSRSGKGPRLTLDWHDAPADHIPGPLEQSATGNAGAPMLALFDALAASADDVRLAAGPAQSLHIRIHH